MTLENFPTEKLGFNVCRILSVSVSLIQCQLDSYTERIINPR